MGLGAAAKAILGPCLPLTRLMLLGRVGVVRSLLALLALLLELGLAHLVGTGICFLMWPPSERLRFEVLLENLILRLSHLEGINKRCILLEVLLAVVSHTLESVRMEHGESLLNLMALIDSSTTELKRGTNLV